MPAGTGLGQSGGGGGMTPSELARLEYLETNEYKITYWASITTDSGSITKPTGSTIVLDALSAGVDAVVETISNGQPTGFSPVTGGGAYVTVSSFDTSGNYTLSGTPSATPVALLYVITIPADQYQNLDLSKIIMPEYNNPVVQTITNGDTSHAPSSDAVYDALALKQNSLGYTAEDTANKSSSYTASSTTTYANTKALVDGLASRTSFVSLKGLNFSPADATNYYFVDAEAPNTNATLFRFYVPSNIVIKKVYVAFVVTTTPASTETSSIYIRVDNTTDTLINNAVQPSATNTVVSNTSFNLSVSAGSYFNIKWTTPTWATNPTNMQINVVLEIANG